jgi:hypothetical protein
MFLEPSEKVTFWTTVAWTLPFDLGRFIDPVLRRISEVKMRNALMETSGELYECFISRRCRWM